MASLSTTSHRPTNARMVQNFYLVWLDGSIGAVNDDDFQSSITKLQQIVSDVSTFVDADKCIDFITDMNEKVFMIISGEFSDIIVPFVQDIPQVNSIYIFCRNNAEHTKLVNSDPKISGVYSSIESIYDALEQATQDCDHNSISISVIKLTDETTNQSLDTLDQSFMNTQLLKEILLTIDFQKEHMNEFLKYCRERFVGNPKELQNVDKIEKEYYDHQPIWWYTYNCFLYTMLNRALRLMEVDLIVKMGFFIRDLHNDITSLHAKQYDGCKPLGSFTLYRGQGLSQTDFDQLKNTQGGLLAFNNFLSTTQNPGISRRFAQKTISNSDLVGVVYLLRIDPSISATCFADVHEVSFYKGENETLFSMHSVFRIGSVEKIDNNDRLWQVELTLTSDTDQQLHALIERLRHETPELHGWHRLSGFMIALGQFDKAKELDEVLLKQTDDKREKAATFHHLGRIAEQQGKYEEAMTIYNKALEICQKILPANHPDLATCYTNIGGVYNNMGEYSKALSYYDKAVEIKQKTLPANHPDLATSYNNIGLVYKNIGEYSKALSYYDKALEIRQKILPENHPSLATSYNNIGLVYDNMGEYSKALSYYRKALEIFEKILPANHPSLATSYNNIGLVYYNKGEYSKALSYYDKALEIRQKTLPANHPDLVTSYSNIGSVCHSMGEYSKALSYFEKALEICQKTLPANHRDLATSYNNTGLVYYNKGEYSKALSYYGKALEIFEKTLPVNHPSLATSYSNIGGVYDNMGEYAKALSYYEKALEIEQKSLPGNHPLLATSYNNIGAVYSNMGKYSKAILFLERSLNILQHSLPTDHPHLKMAKKNVEYVKKKL